MALEITRKVKKDGVIVDEALYFVGQEEAGLSLEDPRLIQLEGQSGFWFWLGGRNFFSAESNFFDETIPITDKQWNPYNHQLQEGVVVLGES